MSRKRLNHQIYTSNEERLKTHQHLEIRLSNLTAKLSTSGISPCEFTSQALLAYIQCLKLPKVGLRPRNSDTPVQLELELFRCRWKGIPDRCIQTLEKWSLQEWQLQLSQDVPTPKEILRMMSEGTRAVSVFSKTSDLLKLHEEKFDSLGFLIHDLMHAYKFFHDPVIFSAQVKISQTLLLWISKVESTSNTSDSY